MIKATNLTIQVKDMDRSISFYQALSFTLTSRWGDHYAQLAAPGIVLGLHPAGEFISNGRPGHLSIGFTTQDLDEAQATLEKMEVPFSLRSEAGGTSIHFSDPDGTALYFIDPKS